MGEYIGLPEVLVEQTETYDAQGGGFTTVEKWAGLQAQLKQRQSDMAGAGYNTKYSKRAGVNELEISVPQPERNPDGSSNEKVTDDWSISTQFAEAEIWADEGLRRYIHDKKITNPDPPAGPAGWDAVDAAISTYKSTINDNLRHFYKPEKNPDGTHIVDSSRTGPTPLENFNPRLHNNLPILGEPELGFVTAVYLHILQGVDHTRVARCTLTRKRTVNAKSALRFKVTNVNEAWVPPLFYTQFEVPTHIQNLLPTVPDPVTAPPPVNTRWAWALTVHESETTTNATTVTERIEWTFAPVRIYTFTIYPIIP